tara:strand:- start:1650 stop:2057 length:408 start_codon:yes stop_codon:yes gene_type:complete
MYVLPSFDETAYAARAKDDSWSDKIWKSDKAFLSKVQHDGLVTRIEVEHGPSFAKDVTWGQLLESNDMPHDGSELVDQCHRIANTWALAENAPVQPQVECGVVVVDAHLSEVTGPVRPLKPAKCVRKKRSKPPKV